MQPNIAASSRSSSVVGPTPTWFSTALEDRPESFMIPVTAAEDANIRVHCLRWGGPSTNHASNKRGIVLMHGNGASNVWWKCIAPFFARDFDVLAISLTGCGASSLRQQYTVENWASEVEQCCRSVGFFDEHRPKPYVVAHSFGSYVVHSMLLQQLFGSGPNVADRLFDGVVFVDVAIRSEEMTAKVGKRMQEIRAKDPHMKPRQGWKRNAPSVTPTERYVLRPFQTCENTFIIRNIAESSVRRYEDGSWTWLGDANRENKMVWRIPALTDKSIHKLAERMPVGFIYGENSVLCDSTVISFVRESLGTEIGIVCVPGAQHHVWLDAPLAFVSALHGLFAGWNSFAFPSRHRDQREDELDRLAKLEARL